MEGTMHHGSLGHQQDHRGNDLGFSMVVTALSLGATAILTVILLTTMFKSGASSNTSVSNAPGVAEATSLQAQQTLSSGLSTVEAAAASAGGYGSLAPSTLSASGASVSFVAGPSSSATTISIAVSGTGGAQIGAGESGSVTLAARASDSVCWLIWKSAEGQAWYGAQTGLSSCTAPTLTSPPSPSPVSSSSIGWQEGSFPLG
jgi:hypothetical protein